jgi:hypothetical protein
MSRGEVRPEFKHLFERRPDYQRTVRSRQAGARPNESLLRRLKRFHPAVDLFWENVRKRWVLVQTDGPQIHVIRVLEGTRGEYAHPTFANTVGYLDSIRSFRSLTRWGLDQWIDDNLSEQVEDPELDKRVEYNINEFSERTWRLEHPKTSITPDPKKEG